MSQTHINVIWKPDWLAQKPLFRLPTWQFPVKLYEMRGVKPTPQHKTDKFAELVCSNSFRGDSLTNAVGLLKEEMRVVWILIIMRAGEAHRVPAGGAMAMDREEFLSSS